MARDGSQTHLWHPALANEIEQGGVVFVHLKEHSIGLPCRQSFQAIAVVALADPAGLLAAAHHAAPLAESKETGDDGDAFPVQMSDG
jgi:hypothetical protein